MKLFGTGLRAMQLLPLAMREKPDLAVSHGSRAQFLAGAMLRIPTVLMYDYEFVNATSFLRPDWLFVPEVIPADRFSQRPDHVFRYHGLKEDVYVPRLKPDRGLRSTLGIGAQEVLVTVRPPATEAHYHNPEGEKFFASSLEFLIGQPHVRVVLLPRNDQQALLLRSEWKQGLGDGRIIIPGSAVDGLNLIWNSDLVISGGGTMNREAAALGVPVYSIFRGRMGAVDQYLAQAGRLTVIDKLEDISTKIAVKHRAQASMDSAGRNTALERIVEAITSIAEDKCLPPRR